MFCHRNDLNNHFLPKVIKSILKNEPCNCRNNCIVSSSSFNWACKAKKLDGLFNFGDPYYTSTVTPSVSPTTVLVTPPVPAALSHV